MLSLRFNSKLVRLKEVIESDIEHDEITFQFQTGSIKRYACQAVRVRLGVFQFQTGSIKRVARCADRFSAVKFQFQTGSIKRRRKRCEFATKKFQFQTGSIKSWQPYPLGHPKCRFNSKLVRLKGQAAAALDEESAEVSIPNWFD